MTQLQAVTSYPANYRLDLLALRTAQRAAPVADDGRAHGPPDAPSAAQYWQSHIAIGFAVMFAEATASVGYLALSGDGPNRGALLRIATVTAVAGLIGVVGAHSLAVQRRRDRFVLTAALGSTVVLGLCAALDGGLESPFLYLAVMPVIYVAQLLSPRAVAACGLFAAAILATVGLTDRVIEIPQENVFMLFAVFVGVATVSTASAVYRTRADEDRGRLVERLAVLAATDPLTGCWNHRAFHARLAEEFERATRYQRPLSLLVCDVDEFKMFNDSYGHELGDAALRGVAATLRTAARAADVVARVGGDEFAVLMPETVGADAAELAERITAAQRARQNEPSLSIGLAAVDGTVGTASDLFGAADAALYRAKMTGRGRVAWAGAAPHRSPSSDGRRIGRTLRRERYRRLQAESVLAATVDAAPVGFAFLDPQLRIVMANRTITDGRLGSHEGRLVAEVVPDLWPRLEPHLRRVIDDRVPVRNMEFQPASRDTAWLANFYPVIVADRLVGVGVVVVDISDRRRLEHSQEVLTDAVVATLASAVEARDPYTAGHQRRVAQISTAVATALGCDEWTTRGIGFGASIHDIGKIAVPAEILSRPRRLSPEEFALVREHSQTGYDMLNGLDLPWSVADMVLQHHERLDGSGYPGGLHEEAIGLGARIIAVADVIEAVASYRPYRPALGLAAALDVVRDGRQRLFDADVVDTAVEVLLAGGVDLSERISPPAGEPLSVGSPELLGPWSLPQRQPLSLDGQGKSRP